MKYEIGEGVRWSHLKHLRDSPKHLIHAVAKPKDTPALARGRAVHCAVYEHETFEKQYVVYPGPVRRGKAWEEFQANNASAEILTEAEHVAAVSIAKAVWDDPVASKILARANLKEHRITWSDERTGVACRGTVDQVPLADLKTTSRGLTSFGSQVARYGYHGQIAWYYDGLEANGYLAQRSPFLIAVESGPPYDVAVFEVGPRELEAGRALYRRLLDRLVRCMEEGEYPGVADGETLPLELPAWALNPKQEVTLGGVALGEVG